jgi:hypothetical protein
MVHNPFQKFEERRRARDEERMKLSKRMGEIVREAEEDAVALKVLHQMYPDGYPSEAVGTANAGVEVKGVSATGEARSVALSASVVAIKQEPPMLVKDMILNILRDAAPTGLNAAQIRGKAALRYKAQINPNTLTVSLCRFAKDGKVRSEGRTWFYIRANGVAAINGAGVGKQLSLVENPREERA